MTVPYVPMLNPGDPWCGQSFCICFDPQSLPILGARLSLTHQYHAPGLDLRLTPTRSKTWIQ